VITTALHCPTCTCLPSKPTTLADLKIDEWYWHSLDGDESSIFLYKAEGADAVFGEMLFVDGKRKVWSVDKSVIKDWLHPMTNADHRKFPFPRKR
jgi:hypothetical protein